MRRNYLDAFRVAPNEVNLPSSTPHVAPPDGNDPRGIERWARAAMDAFGLNDWVFGFDYAKTRLGCCNHLKKRITMSKHYVALNTPEQFRNTLLHEIAHALVGRGHGHDATWRAVARKIGCNGDRCSRAELPLGAWRATCGGCGHLASRHKKPKRLEGWYCKRCGKTKGALAWRKGG